MLTEPRIPPRRRGCKDIRNARGKHALLDAYWILGRIEELLGRAQPEEHHGLGTNRRIEEHLLSANLVIDKNMLANRPLWFLTHLTVWTGMLYGAVCNYMRCQLIQFGCCRWCIQTTRDKSMDTRMRAAQLSKLHIVRRRMLRSIVGWVPVVNGDWHDAMSRMNQKLNSSNEIMA